MSLCFNVLPEISYNKSVSKLFFPHCNVHETFISDAGRVRQLESENFHVGKGEAHGANNACLADSLLQLLVHHRAITSPAFASGTSDKQWRREACLAVRAHLCNHADVTLRPRQRDCNGAIVYEASAEDHALCTKQVRKTTRSH